MPYGINAVMFILELAKKQKDEEFLKGWESLPELTRNSFNNMFWIPDRATLLMWPTMIKKTGRFVPIRLLRHHLNIHPLTTALKSRVECG
jgi:hypothetical protein